MNGSDLLGVFLLGLIGSGHCVGMCGAFAVAVNGTAQGGAGPAMLLLRQLAYQLGKSTSYLALGVMLLFAGTLIEAETQVRRMQDYLGWAAGGVMIVVGVNYALELRFPPTLERWWKGSAVCGAMAALWRSPSLFKSALIGWLNGFLPCGLSLTAIFYLASFGRVETIAVGTYVFGLGTMPALAATAFFGAKLTAGKRRWMLRLTGVLLVLMGALTLVRGRPEVHGFFHKYLMPQSAIPAGATHEH